MRRRTTVILFMLIASTGALTVTAGPVEEEMKKCAAEQDDAARLSCFDALLEAPDPQPSGISPATATVSEPEAVPDSIPARVEEADKAPQVEAAVVENANARSDSSVEDFGVEIQKAEAAALESIESRIVEVQRSSQRKPVIILENDQIWQQTDGYKLRLKDGELVVISRGTFSSFFMQGKSGGGRVRVKRIK